jgi:hypothetical protein
MRPDLLAQLDAHWANHFHCQPAILHNESTNILTHPTQTGVEVWLFGKTCVMLAAPPLAQSLKESIGTRNPIVAFEPGRLRAAIAFFGLELYGPEAVLVKADSSTPADSLIWVPACETASDMETVARGAAASGLPATTISHKHRSARRAAEACGFELYASVIYIGHQPEHPSI